MVGGTLNLQKASAYAHMLVRFIGHEIGLRGEVWRDAPADVLVAVFQHLDLGSKMRMGAVCSAWRESVKSAQVHVWRLHFQ